jgi:hypothetical protein
VPGFLATQAIIASHCSSVTTMFKSIEWILRIKETVDKFEILCFVCEIDLRIRTKLDNRFIHRFLNGCYCYCASGSRRHQQLHLFDFVDISFCWLFAHLIYP